jgi:hypothetical protein
VSQGIGAGVRKAADPGVVERIAGFLGDNGYTRAWARGVEEWPIIPLERMVTSDVDNPRMQAFAKAQVLPDGSVKPGMEAILTSVSGSKEKASQVMQALAAAEPEERGLMLASVFDQLHGKLKPKERVDAASAMLPRNGSTGLSDTGELMRLIAGHPSVAYGLPAAGVGLAAWGIHDVMAAQQRGEKESQLPVSGGMQ